MTDYETLKNHEPLIAALFKYIAEVFEISPQDVCDRRNKSSEAITARYIAWHLMHEVLCMTVVEIREFYGMLSNEYIFMTVYYTVNKKAESDYRLKLKINRIIDRFYNCEELKREYDKSKHYICYLDK